MKFPVLLTLNYSLEVESAIKNKLIDLLSELRGFKFVKTSLLELKKLRVIAETKYSTFYSNSKVETIISKTEIVNAFESIYITIISNMQKFKLDC